MFTTGDKILIGTLIILSIFAFVLISSNSLTYAASNYAVIEVNGVTIERVPFEKEEQLREFEFNFGDEMGVLEIQNGRVRMQKMNSTICPEGICSDIGWIDKPYQTIVCLPNKIVITVESSEDSGVDFITR